MLSGYARYNRAYGLYDIAKQAYFPASFSTHFRNEKLCVRRHILHAYANAHRGIVAVRSGVNLISLREHRGEYILYARFAVASRNAYFYQVRFCVQLLFATFDIYSGNGLFNRIHDPCRRDENRWRQQVRNRYQRKIESYAVPIQLSACRAKTYACDSGQYQICGQKTRAPFSDLKRGPRLLFSVCEIKPDRAQSAEKNIKISAVIKSARTADKIYKITYDRIDRTVKYLGNKVISQLCRTVESIVVELPEIERTHADKT